ncbi:unnamed protein product [Ranitomeya imitator]|uniref:Uncharacterized protein n=1 Tax=Ranitomeya imitator TaxID=111125 RepID=A0ABN9MG87_9NEOB|nr:unnamed protein product [Ranitomeya imitator]
MRKMSTTMTRKKSRMKRSIEMLEYFEQENTPVQSAGTFKTPEGSDHGFLPPKESGNIPSSTVKPKTKAATNKPSLLGKNKPQSRESTTGRIGAGNVTVSQKGEMHKQKNPEKPSIRIVEKRKVTHNGEDQEKSGIDRNTEMYAGVSTAMLFFAEASGSGSGEGPEDSWTSTVEPAPQTIFMPDSTMKQTSPESTGGTEGESLRTEPTVSSLTEIPTDTNAVSYTATDKTSVSTAETSTIVVTTAEASSLLAISTETSPVYDPTTGEISTAVEIITETSFTAAETSPVVDTTVETSSLPKVSIETSPVVDTTEETSSLPKVSIETSPVVDTTEETSSLPKVSIETSPVVDTTEETSSLPKVSIETSPVVDTTEETASLPKVSIETSPVVDTTVETSSLPKISIETSPVVDTTSETSSLPKVSIETSPVVKTYETTGAVSSTTATVPVIDTTLGKVSATPPTIRPVSSLLPHTTEQEIAKQLSPNIVESQYFLCDPAFI